MSSSMSLEWDRRKSTTCSSFHEENSSTDGRSVLSTSDVDSMKGFDVFFANDTGHPTGGEVHQVFIDRHYQ